MSTSGQSNPESKISTLEVTVSALLKGLSYLVILIVFILLLLIYIVVRDLLTTNEPQFADSALQAPLSQQTNDELANAESLAARNEALAQELQVANALASAESIAARNEALTQELQEANALASANGNLLEEARQALQQALLREEEQSRIQQELIEEREQGNARLEQNQQEIEEAQRQLSNSQAQQNQLVNELELLRQSVEDSANREVVINEESQSAVEAQETVRVIQEELARVQQELVEQREQREQGSARLEQNQRELEEVQRQLSNSQAQQTLLVSEIELLRQSNRESAVPEAVINEDIQSTVDVSETDIVVQEEVVSRVQPVYPRLAVQRNIEGFCEVEFTVSTDGEVRDPVIVESDSRGMFDDACLDAIVDFVYSPKTINGVPVIATGVRRTFRFAFN